MTNVEVGDQDESPGAPVAPASTPYEPWDQDAQLGPPPWDPHDEKVQAWEKAHGHDVRLKCYVEFGCQVIEQALERELLAAYRERDELRVKVAAGIAVAEQLTAERDEAVALLQERAVKVSDAEYATLRARVAELLAPSVNRRDFDYLRDHMPRSQDLVDALSRIEGRYAQVRARVAELEPDAEAWRWLMDNLPEGFDGDGAVEALIVDALTPAEPQEEET
jgi:hypothetical protein